VAARVEHEAAEGVPREVEHVRRPRRVRARREIEDDELPWFIKLRDDVRKKDAKRIWDAAFINYEYTKEELKEMFNGKKSDEFWSAFCTILSNKLVLFLFVKLALERK
jgi:hypothetical protein